MCRIFDRALGEESNSGIGVLVVSPFDQGNPVPEPQEMTRQPAVWPVGTPLCNQN